MNKEPYSFLKSLNPLDFITLTHFWVIFIVGVLQINKLTLKIYYKRWILNLLLVVGFSSYGFGQNHVKKPVRIKIASWNIQMLPNGIASLSKSCRKMQNIRVPWIIEYCNKNKYDVIIFQEVFNWGIKQKLKKGLKPEYPYQINTKSKLGRFSSNGIFIVSRIPIKYIDHVIFPRGVHADRWAAKGCTLIEGEFQGVKFQIAGTHLQAENTLKAKYHRNIQYEKIKTLIEKNENTNFPTFIVGDLNTPKQDKVEYLKMLSTLNAKDFPLNDSLPYTMDERNSWNKNINSCQLDYILLQPRQTKTNILNQLIFRPQGNFNQKKVDLADHYGIMAEVEIYNSNK